MALSVLYEQQSLDKNQKSAKKQKQKQKQYKKEKSLIQFPEADIHKWVEGYKLLSIISPLIKCQPAQQQKFPRKQGFSLVLKQP